ncbi:hypothetical protein G6F29_009089 [Rhizopus arrhizus]|nr:hypothetical protein G6F23_010724 [Rhizopus arrhizus]KAG1420920.1 hypothetical protein G6F58_003976 [Rhizopus delemar]KAG0756567.1 hypothetical protein G6F24_011064 [Rhizopus arrhizus]KAG0787287.1 hypothetical protein G6F21_008005 [Rhizopus arrhizus]KAG0797610.1 hypothetical protein G6F22_004654 [Rhizopus arrhizus]
MAENNERTFTQSEVEALFKEFERRLTIKDELKSNETPLPVEIVTELENLSSSQHETNFKKFKRESHRYILDEWTTPEKINKSIYPELKRHTVETSYVVNHVYKLTENTRFQAKTATEIFEQLNFLTTGTLGEEEMQSIILRCREQSRQLAIFGFVQAKKQEREAKDMALKALRLPNSLKYMESAEEDDQRSNNAFDAEFLQQLEEARFKQRLLQQANSNRGRGYVRSGPRGGNYQPRGGSRGGNGYNRGSFFGRSQHRGGGTNGSQYDNHNSSNNLNLNNNSQTQQ